MTATLPQRHEVDLRIEGMTCASCAARVERRLNQFEGVEATVNFATERARVQSALPIDVSELVDVVGSAGYRAQVVQAAPAPDADDGAGHEAQELGGARRRLLVSAILSVPVVVLGMVPALQFDNWQWVSLALTIPVVTWCAWPFHRAAWINLRHAAATMDTLISIGVLAAFGWSLYALIFGGAGEASMRDGFSLIADRDESSSQVFFEVAAGVTTLILLGRYLEAKARRASGAAFRALLELGAKDVSVLADGGCHSSERRIPIDELAVGDRFVVRPGEKVAADGVVEDGASAVDVSLLTGEPVPIEVGPGDAVTGGTVTAGGRLVVRATRVGADTKLAQIARLVQDAQSGKAPVQRLADRISAVFVPLVIAIAAATLAVWLAIGEPPSTAFTAAVAVLIIACPCALGLATPTAIVAGTGRGAQLGILIKGPEVLESTRAIDTVVLDKTGTVTDGAMSLIAVHPARGVDAAELLRLAAGLEHASEHPVAAAITSGAVDAGSELPAVERFESTRGLGISGVVEGRAVAAGRPSFLADRGMALGADLEHRLAEVSAAGRTAVAVGWDGEARGILVVADTVKPTSAEAVSRLRHLGLRPMLLTGDNRRAAHSVAAAVGIPAGDVIAEVLPEGKVAAIRDLQVEGATVAMVGDGVNDAAALAQADLGIAVGSGSDVAIEAADLTIVGGDLRLAADAVRLSRRTLRTIKGNLFWAFAYNVAAIPVAAAGFLHPMLAGAAMACSSLFVVLNSLRLRRF